MTTSPAPHGRRHAAAGGAAARRRVLVVDDNLDGATTLALLLEYSGYDVRAAYDGAAALQMASEFQPFAVVLDIGLPGLDGYEVARRLRGTPSLAQVLLIALTGYGQDSDRERSREAGFDHHFVKPTDPRVLCDVLDGAASV